MFDKPSDVVICLDTIISTYSDDQTVSMPMKITIEHDSLVQPYYINILESKKAQSLNLQKSFKISKENCLKPGKISVSFGDCLVHSEEIDIRKNMVGALKSKGSFAITLIFRVINSPTPEVVIHGVHQYEIDEFQHVRELGCGTFGITHEVVDSSQQSHVLKIIKQGINIKNKDDVAVREIVPLIALPKHPCLIKLEGFIYSKYHGIILVLEYVSRGKISTIDFKKLDNDIKYKLFYGLFSCVAFLHDYGFIHRDICPDNVLVSEDYEIKLIDFGVSRFIDNVMTSDQGHERYQSPEMKTSNSYNEKVDEFSLGVLLDALNIEKSPFILLTKRFFQHQDVDFQCSDVCILIESEVFHTFSIEIESYFNELHKYHQPAQLRDSTIFYSGLICFENNNLLYGIDFIVLAFLLDFKSAYYIYALCIMFFEGVAFDNYYHYLIGNIDPIFKFEYSKDKYQMWCDILPLEFDSLRVNYLLFTSYHFFEFYWEKLRKMSEKEIRMMFITVLAFKEEQYHNNYKFSAFNISKRLNRPEYIFLFGEAAFNYYNSFNDIVMSSYEGSALLGSIDGIELYAYICLYERPELRKKGKLIGKWAICQYNCYSLAKFIYDVYNREEKYKKAYKYLKIAVKLEKFDYFYYCDIGLYHFFGLHGKINKQKGVKYLKMGANEGNPDAQYRMAILNFCGICMERNVNQAYYYNCLSISQGCYYGLYLHGIFFFFGIAVNQDFTSARIIFEKCLEYFKSGGLENWNANWVPELLIKLVIIHIFGLGVDINFEKANQYFSELLDFHYDPSYEKLKDMLFMIEKNILNQKDQSNNTFRAIVNEIINNLSETMTFEFSEENIRSKPGLIFYGPNEFDMLEEMKKNNEKFKFKISKLQNIRKFV